MAFPDTRRSGSVAHKYVFRIVSIRGSTVDILWDSQTHPGASLGDAESEAERLAAEARAQGSDATIALDCFRIEVEKWWVQRPFISRPPSVAPAGATAHPILQLPARRPRILYLPLEFATWGAGGASWSYAACLAYVEGLRRAGCDVTVINTPCAPFHKRLIRERRFDQVWFHLHPKHLDDFTFRQWVSDIAPVRLMLCGETVHYGEAETVGAPWNASHTQNFRRWAPHVTHAAFVDPADVAASASAHPHLKSLWWQQAVPERFVLPVNRRPKKDAALFMGTLYPPRDRWAWELGPLLQRAECPESQAFTTLFEKSHDWIQRALEKTDAERNPWWTNLALRSYNRLQVGMRRHAFHNFLSAMREGVAVVSLPTMLKTYSGRVFEGMAAGRPVITQRIPGQPEIFKDGVEILHYETAGELGQAIRWLQRNPVKAVEIATAARAAILRDHTVEKRTQQLLDFVAGRAAITTMHAATPATTGEPFPWKECSP